MSNKTYSLGYLIKDSESTENYKELLTMLKKELHIKNPVIICADGHKAIPKAIEEVYPESRQQLCLIHLERELKKEVKSTYLKKKLNELFKEIKTVANRKEAENKIHLMFEYFDKISKLYTKYQTENTNELSSDERNELKKIGLKNVASIANNYSKL